MSLERKNTDTDTHVDINLVLCVCVKQGRHQGGRGVKIPTKSMLSYICVLVSIGVSKDNVIHLYNYIQSNHTEDHYNVFSTK